MNRSNLLGTALLVVGLLLGGLIVERAGAQARTVRAVSWPPAPEDLVHVRKAVMGIEDGDFMDAFDVPTDKWLVLTDVRFDVVGENGNNLPIWNNLELGEDRAGIFTPKIGHFTAGVEHKSDRAFQQDGPWSESGIPFISVTGKCWHPGSRVRIRYTNTFDPKGDGLAATVSCNLTGYLVVK